VSRVRLQPNSQSTQGLPFEVKAQELVQATYTFSNINAGLQIEISKFYKKTKRLAYLGQD